MSINLSPYHKIFYIKFTTEVYPGRLDFIYRKKKRIFFLVPLSFDVLFFFALSHRYRKFQDVVSWPPRNRFFFLFILFMIKSCRKTEKSKGIYLNFELLLYQGKERKKLKFTSDWGLSTFIGFLAMNFRCLGWLLEHKNFILSIISGKLLENFQLKRVSNHIKLKLQTSNIIIVLVLCVVSSNGKYGPLFVHVFVIVSISLDDKYYLCDSLLLGW